MDVALYKFSVMPLDDIQPSFVRHALSIIPGIFQFDIVEKNESEVKWMKLGGFEFAEPIVPNTIIVFNGTLHGHKKYTPTGYHLWRGRSTIAWRNHTPMELARLIMHEIMHGVLPKEINIDSFDTYKKDWIEWTKRNNLGEYPHSCIGALMITRFMYLVERIMESHLNTQEQTQGG